MKKILFALLLSVALTPLFAQTWTDLILEPNTNFYDVQDAFYEEWGDKEYERGKGYKQFKRWEYFMEPRVYPTGNALPSDVYYEAWKEARRASQNQAKDDSEWEPYGPVSWDSEGWNPGLGRINAVARHPSNADILFVGTPAGGLWKSEDAGSTWTPLTDNLPAIGVSGIAIHPTSPDTMYIGTGDGDGGDTYSIGVLKSVDGGVTWEETGLIHEVQNGTRCNKIIIDPTNDQKLLVATNDGLFVSEDGGTLWTETIVSTVRDIELNPENPDIVYASSDRFYLSTDGGMNFSIITDGLPSSSNVSRIATAVTPANSDFVYLVVANSNNGFFGLYQSTDEGASFDQMSNSPNILTYSPIGDGNGGQAWYDLAIAASPTDEDEIYVGGINVWRSDNAGVSWTITSHWVYPSDIGYTHADIHSLDFYGDDLYCGSDGGVFITSNSGNEWTDLSEGLQISQYYRIALSTTDPNKVLTGSQDNGTNIFNGSDEYIHLLGGDGNWADIDPNNDDIMYMAYPGGDFQKSTDGGNSWSNFSNGSGNGAWVTPLEFDPVNSNVMYAAFSNVQKNSNGSWEMLGSVPGSGTLRALRVAPSNNQYIYTARNGNIYRTTNGGDSWQGISSSLPNLSITWIEVDPENEERVWITMSGYNSNAKVFYSDDAGSSWTNYSNGLPNVPANCISYQFGSNDGLYVGTDVGVYYRNSNELAWISYNEGLPNVIVNDIDFQYDTGKIFIGTYGRGVWTNDFFDAGSLLPIADFVSTPELICEGGQVEYTNLSLYVGEEITWTFEGGDPATSTETNPVVTYPTAGVYSAKLRVGNENGLDSLILETVVDVLPSTGEAPPIVEGFEEVMNVDDLDWYVVNPDQGETWSLNSEVGHESEQSLWINNMENTPLNEDFFESRTYDLSGLDTAFVTFRAAYAKRPGSSSERLKVEISTDCGETWSFKKLYTSSSALPSAPESDTPFEPASADEWNYFIVDNIDPEERTSNFRVRFTFRSNSGNNVYIDDINIDSDFVSGLNDVDGFDNEMVIFPNPATGDQMSLEIEMQETINAEVGLYDVLGRKVESLWSGALNAGVNTLNLELGDTSTGIYVLRVTSQEGTIAAQQLVVE